MRYKITCFEVVAIGSIESVYFYPGDVFRMPLILGAYGMIVVHNHPYGDPRPSKVDIRLTKELSKISKIMRIRFYDHIIIGTDGYYSFAEKKANLKIKA